MTIASAQHGHPGGIRRAVNASPTPRAESSECAVFVFKATKGSQETVLEFIITN